jgi:hypothetical protein
MAFPGELAGYTSEDDFIRRFLVPVLGRIGFSIVVDFHGNREFGKDLIIGEIDRFGHVCYYGVQAKYQATLGKAEVQGLIDDCKEAFAKQFDHPQTGTEHRISRFYAVTAGSISNEARDVFFASLTPLHSDNVRLLDGKDLLDLDRSAAVRSESTRDLLSGVLLEARHNLAVLSSVHAPLQEIVNGSGHGVAYPAQRLRLIAMSAWLLRPLALPSLPAAKIEEIFAQATSFNRTLDDVGVSPLHTVVSIKIPAIHAAALVGPLSQHFAELQHSIEQQLAQLGPIAPI